MSLKAYHEWLLEFKISQNILSVYCLNWMMLTFQSSITNILPLEDPLVVLPSPKNKIMDIYRSVSKPVKKLFLVLLVLEKMRKIIAQENYS